MNLAWQQEPFERYELTEAERYHFAMPRRDFLALLGGGIAVLLTAPELAAGTQGQDREPDLGSWLAVDGKGGVTAFSGKVEVGQGARTSLVQAIAEELAVPCARVTMVLGDTDRVPYDNGTFGSQTTPRMVPQLRRAAAAAREWLCELAAAKLAVPRGELTVADGAVRHAASGRSVAYADLAAGMTAERRVAADVAVARPADWKVCGTSQPRVDGRALVTGAHRYPYDVARPGMLHGKVLRPPAYGAKLQELDDRAAKGMAGVTVVRDGDFVGVAAVDAHTAGKALAALVAKWDVPAGVEETQLDQRLRQETAGGRGGGRGGRDGGNAGDVDGALQQSKHQLRATFTLPYIAHAPLEPRAAVAEWADGKLTVWTGTQRPFGVHQELTRAFRLPADKVRVLVPDTGSGYGGKHTGDAAVEAAALAKAAGKPVAVRWTREEEFTWAYFRPAGVIDVRGGVDAQGKLIAWEFHNFNSGSAGLATPYVVANRREQFHAADSPLRQGSYRALASTANHFARESAIDDLAAAAGVEPLAFRRQNLGDPRLLAVLDAAAERAGKDQPREGVARGFACGTEKGGFVATVADVQVDAAQKVVVRRLVTAFECGAILDPDNVKNQVDGMLVHALGGALFEAIRFGQGRIHNPHFAQYRVPRCLDVPELVTVLLDRRDLPSAGAGEAPIIGVAPAIRNALAAATGQRLRSLPLRLA